MSSSGSGGKGDSTGGSGKGGRPSSAGGSGRNGGAAANGGAASAGRNGGEAGSGMMSGDAVCGNGMVEMGETCDPPGTCPTVDSCRATDKCLMPMLVGSMDTCDVRCELVAMQTCSAGDGCCPSSCTSTTDMDCSASCGDGMVADGETCEPMSADSPCPMTCDDENPCTADQQTGTTAQCNVVCTNTPITQPAMGDQCCPPDADANNDTDCSVMCGNGIVEPGEKCDGNCPETCDDQDPCTADEATGAAEECTFACTNTPITEPAAGDGCCPKDADANGDADCSAMCGNGVKEGSETCDGNDCPSSCDDDDPCTTDTPTGSAERCTAACAHMPITSAAGGDGCCPDRANANTDSDCEPECGNGVTEKGETCDGSNCTMRCDDGNACTSDGTTGSPDSCDVECENRAITPCCGNGRREAGETCDGADCARTCTTSRPCMDSRPVGRAADCNVECVETMRTPCCGNGIREGSETCDGDCATIRCDDGEACTDDSPRTGSPERCNYACGTPTRIGSGVENFCGGCAELPVPPTPDPTRPNACPAPASSWVECQLAGEYVCSGRDRMTCQLREVVRLATETCEEPPYEVDNNCNGLRDEGCP